MSYGSAPPPYVQPGPYPMAQPPYPPGPPPHTTQPQVIYQTVVNNPSFGNLPVNTVCPHCHAMVVTGIRHENGLLTWLLCGGLALVGCWVGCCLIPFFVDSCKDTIHFCPSCLMKIGESRRL